MKLTPAVPVLALAAGAALALPIASDAPEPRRISPGSHWWISDAACTITGFWGSPDAEVTSLSIEPTRDGRYRLDVANSHWRDLPVDADIRAGVGFDGGARSAGGEAFGFSLDDGGQLLRLWVEPAVIDRLDDHRELDIYRDGTLLISIGLDASAEAVAAMKACDSAFQEADRLTNDVMDAEIPANVLDEAAPDDSWEVQGRGKWGSRERR